MKEWKSWTRVLLFCIAVAFLLELAVFSFHKFFPFLSGAEIGAELSEFEYGLSYPQSGFRWLRFFTTTTIFFLIYFLTHSQLTTVLTSKCPRQTAVQGVMAALLVLFAAFTTWTSVPADSKLFIPSPLEDIQQVDQVNGYLPDALLKGQVYLDFEPPAELIELENPYSPGIRTELGLKYRWDTTYYNGKYYCYFGVVPILLLFFPIRALTGYYLNTAAGVFLFASAAMIALLWLWRVIVRRYFPKLPFLLNTLGGFTLAVCSMLLYQCREPQFHEVPVAAGIAFAASGLALLLTSLEKPRLSLPRLTGACICLGLAVGCRPTLVFVSVLVPVLLLPKFKELWQERKRFFLMITAIVIPYMLIGCGLMWYNYIRYGTVFEFGNNYLLTTANAEAYSLLNPTQKLDKLFTGLKAFFYNPLQFSSGFPFVTVQKPEELLFNGYLFYQGVPGMMNFPVYWSLYGFPFISSKIRRTLPELWRLILCLLGIGFVILATEVLAAGLNGRYMVDFSWLFLLTALLLLFFFFTRSGFSSRHPRIVGISLSVIMVASILSMVFLSLTADYNWLKEYHPRIYYELYYLFSLR